MRYIIPHYFDAFRCVAAECQDTCCAGWQIMIDDVSLERYKTTGGSFGQRLSESINWQEGSFKQHDCKRCAFLNDDNLCDMQMIGGEQMLCDTCRDYPRHMEEYEGLREGSLSLSCIEAAKLILGCMETVQFYALEDDTEDEEYEDFDFLLFDKLMDARERIIELLQDREADIRVRMALVLQLAEDIQKAIDENDICRIDTLLQGVSGEDVFFAFERDYGEKKTGANEYYNGMRKLFRIFSKMETLKDNWPEYVKKAEWALFGEGQRGYEENRRDFEKDMAEDYENFSRYMEQLMVYFVYVYFCGAVYDGDALGKMKTAIASTVLIRELIFAVWIEKGDVTFADVVDVAHRYSREIEHSDVNLLRLEKLLKNTVTYPVGNFI